MKMSRISFMLCFCLLIFQVNLNFAQPSGIIVREKKISKHFSVHPGDSFTIKNQFGNVYVHTWDKNEIAVSITQRGKASQQSRAEQILKNISIIDTIEGNISFKTTILTPYNNDNGVHKATDKIYDYEANVTYVVTIPKYIYLHIQNTFGAVYIDDFTGKLSLDITHGSFHTKKILGSETNIRLVDGKERSTIESIKSGSLIGEMDRGLSIENAVDTATVSIKGWSPLIINNVNIPGHGW